MSDHILHITEVTKYGTEYDLECVGHDKKTCNLQTWWFNEWDDLLKLDPIDIPIPVRAEWNNSDEPTIVLAEPEQSPLAEAAHLLLAANTADWEDCDVCAAIETLCPYHQGRSDEHDDLLVPGPGALWVLPEPEPEPVRPADKVLCDDTGAAIPVRCIEHIFARDGKVWVGFTDGTANVVFNAESKAESAKQRDRIIREIWDSPKRIVCSHEDDPMHESSDA